MSRVVITSIQPPTSSVLAMLAKAMPTGLRILVIGDRKTPVATWPEGIDFLGIGEQGRLGYSLPAGIPENHYSRKNIGYLLAMTSGSALIYDTDDDNAPMESGQLRGCDVSARRCLDSGWINAYAWFSDKHIWPRGLPLLHAKAGEIPARLGPSARLHAPIQQGLADGSPDVDAVWRLLMDQDVSFRNEASVLLPAGSWCPFNSQSTWWFPDAYPLIYLPSFVSFRMTDIWRSFVAQRCLWELGHGVVFHGPEVFQDRNQHDLERDFEQEVPGYLGNGKIRELLERTVLQAGNGEVGNNLRRCYEALIQARLAPSEELPLVEAWLADVDGMASGARN